jgi:hypothetical protein
LIGLFFAAFSHRRLARSKEPFDARTAACTIFSAVEAQKSRSSIVAINVDSFSLHFILVTTLCSLQIVLIVKPRGVLTLSGETALAMAFAMVESL